MPDTSFETAFADLAHASLQDKAPGLMEYLIGFQLLDKNEEETHAIGVFGFKVGNQWFYAPSFFLNGMLKGMDQLWVKGQDIFCPLQDNWVNYLISKQPVKLGQSESMPESKLRLLQPDFRVFSETPGMTGSKWASCIRTKNIAEWAQPFLPAYERLLNGTNEKIASARADLDLRAAITKQPLFAIPLAQTMHENAKFAEAVLNLYDLSDLLPNLETIKQAAAASNMLSQAAASGLPGTSSAVPGSKPVAGLPGTSAAKKPKLGGNQLSVLPGKQPMAGAGDITSTIDSLLKSSEAKNTSYPESNMRYVGADASDNEVYRDDKNEHYVLDHEEVELRRAPKFDEHARNKVLGKYVVSKGNQGKKWIRAGQKKTAEDAQDNQIQRDSKSPDLQVFTQADIPQILTTGEATLDDKEKEQLRRGEIVVRDHRNNTSKVYNAEYSRNITNPTESGIYDVLGMDGKFQKCLIVSNPKTIGSGRTAGVCTLVSMDGDKKYGSFRNIDLIVYRAEEQVRGFSSTFEEFYNSAKTLSSMKPGYRYVAVTDTGAGTIPFKFLMKVSRDDGTTSYMVSQDTNVRHVANQIRSSLDRSSGGLASNRMGIETDDVSCSCPCEAMDYEKEKKLPYSTYELSNCRSILESDRASVSKMHNTGAMLVTNKDALKVVEIGINNYDGGGEWREKHMKDIANRFDPGTMADAEMFVIKLGAQQVIVHQDGPETILRHQNGQTRLGKEAMLKHLICDWQLNATEAKQIIKKACERRQPREYWIKLADEMQNEAPTAPAFPPYTQSFDRVLGTPINEQQTNFMPVQGMKPKMDNRNAYKLGLLDNRSVGDAIQASKNGQKDIFDTSVMNGLIKAVDVGGVIDSFLPGIIKGMDRVGRVLFMFYWHYDEFSERYGRQDMVDLEDSLRNVFKSSGDLVLFLKQKSMDAEPAVDSMDLEIGS